VVQLHGIDQVGPSVLRHEKCRGKSIPATVEEVVWGDIESFLRNPGKPVEELASKRGAVDELMSLALRKRSLCSALHNARFLRTGNN
jgi:hypothetical protein